MANRTKILSSLIVCLFALNIFALTGIVESKSIAMVGTSVEQFFVTVGQPSDILAKMMSQKAQNKTPCNKTKQESKKDVKMTDYAITAVSAITLLFWSFVLCVGGNLSEQITKITKYPLKIPWRLWIFLILIMKMLFNILPRSISVNVYAYAVKKACVE